jgi:hypothetical protein
MILLYVSQETNRLKYIVDFIFTDILRTPYQITTDKDLFIKSELSKVSYGKAKLADEFLIPSSNLLFESDIVKQPIDVKNWNEIPIIYKMDHGDIPFDFFASSFYLVSRYEEYLPHSSDRHSRFRPEESLAFRGGFLDRPIINVWADEFKKVFQKRYSSFSFPFPVYVFTPTIDIDNAYAYKYKGFVRSAAILLSKLVTFEFKKFARRVAVYSGYKKDPYDSYERQETVHKTYNINPLYFILLGDFSKYDRNLSHKNKYMIQLIQRLSKSGTIGLHPSYNSNKSESQLLTEKARLENIVGKSVARSRQHYIKLKVPQTYRTLIKAGINEDYSMGYPSLIGYRASTATPFYFFDLEQNLKTALKIFPFVAMDSTLKYYLRFKTKEVIPYLRPIVNELKKIGGNFIFVFHNESIGDGRNWKHWGEIYEKVIKLALEELED